MLPSARSICQITTVHPRYDIRIFNKICLSLVSYYRVTLIVADGKGDEIIDGVTIIDIGHRNSSRIKRMLFTSRSAYRKAIELDSEVFHFHDPEFLFYGLKLSRKGKKVIYDVHEDVPKQTLSKDYINPFVRRILAHLIKKTENFISSRLYAIITVTPFINERFQKINERSIIINNYPVKVSRQPISYNNRSGLCYIGSISRIRGIKEIIRSLENIDTILNLAGDFESEEFRKELISENNWIKVNYYGTVGTGKAIEIMSKSQIGIVTYLPEPNHINGQPNKMFEYMAAGLPVISSDFPLWKEIIEGNNCGICVNPDKPEDISKAINYLLINQEVAEAMGKNGIKSVDEKFNWNSEKEKLLTLYSSVFQ
jgi:glycosyltransferase involved in cell wall biosynthesis